MAETVQEIRASEPGRIDRTVQELTGLTRARVRALFDNGCVSRNGKPVAEAGELIRAGDRIRVKFDPERRYRERPPVRSSKFRLLFEDEHLVVVDKPSGILSVPTEKREPNTLVHEVAKYVNRGPIIRRKVGIVHRLDRDTSGVLVFGKTEGIARALKDQFAARKPERVYLAFVAGALEPAEGTFRSHLATAPDLDQYSTADATRGKLAVTHYRVLERTDVWSFVEVTLETGRRNQIRVHMAEAGHPVLGDTRYRKDLASRGGWRPRRLALHAAVLGFTHPITGEKLRFESALPPEFAAFRRAARQAPAGEEPRAAHAKPAPQGAPAKRGAPRDSAPRDSAHRKPARQPARRGSPPPESAPRPTVDPKKRKRPKA